MVCRSAVPPSRFEGLIEVISLRTAAFKVGTQGISSQHLQRTPKDHYVQRRRSGASSADDLTLEGLRISDFGRAPARQDLPRGLNQLSNTCYLNSVLQYFYTIKDLRETVVSMSKDAGTSTSGSVMSRSRIDGRLLTPQDIARSMSFVGELACLFEKLERDKSPSITPTTRLARLALGTLEESGDIGRQHDVTECMANCTFHLKVALLQSGHSGVAEALRPTAQYESGLIQRLFCGTIRQRIVAWPCITNSQSAAKSNKEDLFSHLILNVTEDGIDIHDGLISYFDDENVFEFDGQECRMEVELLEMPLLLQMHIQRAQFDLKTRRPFKNQAYIVFGETLYMDRYVVGGDPLKKRKSKVIQDELQTCRSRLSVLRQNERRTEQVQAETAGLQVRMKELKGALESLWEDSKSFPYDLTSVFVHSGHTGDHGHYFLYSRNVPAHPDEWLKYNDSEVTMVVKEEIFADTTGHTTNPYLLVFAQKGSCVVNTVNRVV
ncbi:hypothetical protein BD626DRAFT_572392 [Schizophyllum amplum]|uniref:ubiquitinyl hydrolase 1 n=1 Tax=Schizophyllum amplum TaxID=97359 RepID=A0A550C4H6_9AGAR|nr:hypothetical protein BD626DRAFT_572392 [Auriculariopsis ampla]